MFQKLVICFGVIMAKLYHKKRRKSSLFKRSKSRKRTGVLTGEAVFQEKVIALCHSHNYKCFHIGDSRTVTERGFPDCVITNGLRMLILELKSDVGEFGENQAWWLDSFRNAGVSAAMVRPASYESIHEWLHGAETFLMI